MRIIRKILKLAVIAAIVGALASWFRSRSTEAAEGEDEEDDDWDDDEDWDEDD